MKRINFFVGSALALFATAASATDHQVAALTGPNRFDPPTLSIEPGDTVTFTNQGGFHNVRSDDGAMVQFRCANGCDGVGAGDGDPAGVGWTATVTFPTAGTEGFHCELHGGNGGEGMSGTITIGSVGAPVISLGATALDGTADGGASTVVPFTIGNTGDADLTWNADAAPTDCASPATIPWLSLAPTDGTVAAGDPATTVNVTLDAATLAGGVYTADVCVHSNDATNDLVVLPVTFTVSAPDISLDTTALAGAAEVGASTSVPFAISNDGTADLTWNADTALADCATPATIPWISLAPVDGTVAVGDPAATVDVTLDAATLTAGVYNADVCVHSNDTLHDLIVVPVTFTVGASDTIFFDGFDP